VACRLIWTAAAKNAGSWLSFIENWQHGPRLIPNTRFLIVRYIKYLQFSCVSCRARFNPSACGEQHEQHSFFSRRLRFHVDFLDKAFVIALCSSEHSLK
jgi:hypothetical protein